MGENYHRLVADSNKWRKKVENENYNEWDVTSLSGDENN